MEAIRSALDAIDFSDLFQGNLNLWLVNENSPQYSQPDLLFNLEPVEIEDLVCPKIVIFSPCSGVETTVQSGNPRFARGIKIYMEREDGLPFDSDPLSFTIQAANTHQILQDGVDYTIRRLKSNSQKKTLQLHEAGLEILFVEAVSGLRKKFIGNSQYGKPFGVMVEVKYGMQLLFQDQFQLVSKPKGKRARDGDGDAQSPQSSPSTQSPDQPSPKYHRFNDFGKQHDQ